MTNHDLDCSAASYPMIDFPEERSPSHNDPARNNISFSVDSQTKRRRHPLKPMGALTLVPAFSVKDAPARNLHKSLSGLAALKGFNGDAGQSLLSATHTSEKVDASIVHYGLGETAKLTAKSWRKSLISAFTEAGSLKAASATLILPDEIVGHKKLLGAMSLFEIGKLTAETITMVLYRRNHYKTAGGGFKAEARIKSVTVSVAGLGARRQKELQRGLEAGAVRGYWVNVSRDTANEPANICTPSFMARQAQRVVSRSGGSVTLKVLGTKECRGLGMNAFVAVGLGSDEEQKFGILDYIGPGWKEGDPILGYVGKTVTFDSGGLDIKPADGMRDMKYDMCGGADVISAIAIISALRLAIRVKAFFAATENMTGGKAMRPGDVYTGMDGRTYEIDNTDAEGRLTLVDAISYARIKGGVTHLVDYATLTGAVLVALGDQCAGVVTNNQDWCDRYLSAAKSVGERAHQFPVFPEYEKQNESEIADVKNTGGRLAGSITAGCFVMKAAGDLPIVHVDIAGTGFRSKAFGAYPAGGTGWGVLALVALAEQFAQG